ncbi:MAG: type transport system ATP-binding protein [Chloroflexia bacterium]|jgi:ABC-2 type transport system ATP-binding protein|nr:type transport system ATP-binding protein [Chloroflexia bacterium]
MPQVPATPQQLAALQDPSKLTQPIPTVGGSQAAPPTIVVRNVSKVLGGNTVVHNLEFEVQQGEIFGFIGPSGSGKTTTIRLLTGVYTPTTGEVTVMGVAPSHPSRKVQEHFGYMPQLFVLYPNLTVRENLTFVAELYGMSRRDRNRRVDELLTFVELEDARNRLASDVSGGMQRRIELAASLLHNPSLIFADEPTAGIDPVLRGKFWDEFRRLKTSGRTIFVTTQYVGESEYCDRVGVIREGRIVAVDTPIGLRRRAFGGDIVDVGVNGLTVSTVQALEELPIVKYVQPVSRNEVRVGVGEAGPAIPAILEVISAQNCEVRRVEEYRPNFDEVFIRLMEQDAAARAQQEANNGAEKPHV